MSQENAVFSFELNESLYFERGQEVAEIIGISLDPEISIQPFNDYISIRGVIELNGEYQRVSESEERGDNSYNLEDYSSRRYVEQVSEAERGEASFSHRFPVEISVPTYRVSDMNDVTVSVDYFDYEIPDQNQLRLTSIIAIQGINDIGETEEDDEEMEEQEEQEEVVSLGKEQTFRFDIKEQLEKDDSENEQEEFQQTYTREPYNIADETEDEEIIEEETKEEEPYRPPSSSVKSSEENEEEQPSEEKIDYLSNMFRRDEERYSKMKLCIVQDNDTIETIAERYQVNPLQITKQNNLEEEAVSEGQLLYIPVKN